MPSDDLERQTCDPPGARIFILSCVAVFVVIAAWAAYFVARMLV